MQINGIRRPACKVPLKDLRPLTDRPMTTTAVAQPEPTGSSQPLCDVQHLNPAPLCDEGLVLDVICSALR